MDEIVLKIAEYLGKYQESTGVCDPYEKKVLPYSYTTAFYALLCSLLYKKFGTDEWKDRAVQSIKAELKIIDQENAKKQKTKNFHWEFKNYALMNCYILLRNDLDISDKKEIKVKLKNWKNANVRSSNWRAMRALSYLQRYRQFGKLKDLFRARLELKIVLERQTKDGFFPDTKDSYSFQYHAYTLALLYQYYMLTLDDRVKKAFLKGVNLISYFIDPVGDFNYFGRGQEQIFGYASLIFSLEGAAKISLNGKYKQSANRVLSYLKSFDIQNGIFPLVLNNNQDERAGWYFYNRLGDYLSFSGVYLFYSDQEFISIDGMNREPEYTYFFPDTGFFVTNRENYFLAISTGTMSEIGGLIHIFPKIIPCSGGPIGKQGMFIEHAYELNYMGPYYKGNPIKNKVGNIGYKKNLVKLAYDLEEFGLEYQFCINKGIILKIKISPKKKISIIPLHFSSFKNLRTHPITELTGEIFTPDGKVNCYESKPIELKEEFNCDIEIIKGSDDFKENKEILLHNPKSNDWSRNVLELAWIILFDYFSK